MKKFFGTLLGIILIVALVLALIAGATAGVALVAQFLWNIAFPSLAVAFWQMVAIVLLVEMLGGCQIRIKTH